MNRDNSQLHLNRIRAAIQLRWTQHTNSSSGRITGVISNQRAIIEGKDRFTHRQAARLLDQRLVDCGIRIKRDRSY